MTQKQFNIVKQAYAILAKEFHHPKANCKAHASGCWQCRTKLFMRDFECVIEDQQEMNKLK